MYSEEDSILAVLAIKRMVTMGHFLKRGIGRMLRRGVGCTVRAIQRARRVVLRTGRGIFCGERKRDARGRWVSGW